MLKINTKEITHTIEYMGAKFEVVPMTKTETLELIEANTSFKKVQKSKSSKPEYVEKTDFLEVMVQKIDNQIRGWSGLDGNPKCDTSTKRELATRKENEHICTFLIEEIEEIGKAAEAEKEETVKN